MKHQLLALSLLAASGLMAQNNEMQSSQMTSSSCGDPCAPCKPCCVPQPRKCIDCECYTPSYYNLQCDWGAFVSVDFLYWYAGESGTLYANSYYPSTAATPTVNDLALNSELPQDYSFTGTKWKPGFRVGLGWNTACDGWDAYLNWTYYHNRKTAGADYESPVFGEDAFNGAANPMQGPLFGNVLVPYANVSADWALNLNSIDLTMGRKGYLSRYFTLRPYAGVRGAWTRIDLINRATTEGPVTYYTAQTATADTRSHFINRYWGVGFVAGIQPTWYFMPNFSLFADADVSLIWGKFRSTTSTKNNWLITTADGPTSFAIPQYNTVLNPVHYEMRQIIDMALGFSWEENWCSDRFRSELDIGWEHHVWLNHAQRPVVTGQILTQTAQENFEIISANRILQKSDVGMGGLMVRFRFDF